MGYLHHDPAQHAAYVDSWIKTLQEDPMEIIRAAKDAEKIHGFVLDLEREVEQKPLNEANSDATTDLKAAFDKALEAVDPNLESQMRFLETSMRMVVQDMSDEARVQAQQNFYNTQLGQFEQSHEVEVEF